MNSGVADLLKKNSALWRDTRVIDIRRVPNDIEILPLLQQGVYRSVSPTYILNLPVRGFVDLHVTCCKEEIVPICSVRTVEGSEWLVFTYSRSNFFKGKKYNGNDMDDLKYTPLEYWEFVGDIPDQKSLGKVPH